MSHTYAQNVIHVVFSTKERRKNIPEEMQPRLWAYTAGVCKNLGILVHAIGGTDNHVHLLIQIPPTLTLAEVVSKIKSNSSRWAGEKFEWQEGYGAFSVSHSVLSTAVRYVENQKAHHQKVGFDAEFLALLKKHGVVFDVKYALG